MSRESFSVAHEVLSVAHEVFWPLAIACPVKRFGYWVEFTNRTKLYSTTNVKYLMDAL